MKEDFIKKLNIIWFALIFGQIIFLCVILLVFQDVGVDEGSQGLFEYVAVGALLPMVMMSQVLYKKQIQRAQASEVPEEEKLMMYQTATIVKAGLMEGGNIFCLIVYLITGVQWLLIPIVAVLGLFFMQRPSVQKYDLEVGSRF
ncbi:hypothetical protein [uncultured Microscilla sp.]|uniref:hypothetical protein n=1 Tax=uncultured Microscilla sp. TaxID=432653 RepID=UPI002624064C|nr:hypothetical protein [uncultured Microscilla sp.]